MCKFNEIIGYKTIKEELKEIADILKNNTIYENLGACAPTGLLLHGEPGVGKTMMASALIEESGLNAFMCKKDQPRETFVATIKSTFEKAIKNAPSIVFLDDMDKFANGDGSHPDAEEYVTVQSCIDSIKGKRVFVIATVNVIRNLPTSLRRAGRFDKILEIKIPTGKDAQAIISHYLRSKKIVENMDIVALARILEGLSCAEIESLINEAGIYAGYKREKSITMEHVLNTYLRSVYDIKSLQFNRNETYDLSNPNATYSQIVYHEAGHAVVSEILCPNSVTIVCAHNKYNQYGGFTDYYEDENFSPIYWKQSRIVCALGGMAGIEQKYGIVCAGSKQDLSRAVSDTYKMITQIGTCGLNLCTFGYQEDSAQRLAMQEYVVNAEIEKYYRKAKEIIAQNRDFFEKIAQNLAQKHVLTSEDIQKLKSSCQIVSVSL